jgi:hypothetical protein
MKEVAPPFRAAPFANGDGSSTAKCRAQARRYNAGAGLRTGTTKRMPG